MHTSRRTFGKEWLFQLKAAGLAAITAPVPLAIPALANANFFQGYFFFFVLGAPVYLTFGAFLAALIEWAKRRFGIRGAAGAAFSIAAFAAAGAAAMYAYLATVLNGLQLHTTPDVAGLLAIGAGCALYMYVLSLALAAVRRRKPGAGG